MTRTIPSVVSCLSLFVLGCLLLPFQLKATLLEASLANSTPGDTLIYSLQDCEKEVSICLDSLPLIEAINLSFMVNGAPYQKTIAGCNFDTISAYTYTTLFGQGESGPYELTAWQVGDTIYTGRFETIPDLVDSMNLWDAAGNWLLDETAKLISGGNGSTSYSDMSVQVVALNTPSFIGYNFGMEAKGTKLSFGAGVHRIVILDTLNNTIQSTVVIATCSNQQVIEARLLPGEEMMHCLGNDNLVAAIANTSVCNTLRQENVVFELTANDSCILFSGNKVGIDTACIVVCDVLGFCDTTLLIAETYDVPHFRTDTLNLIVGDSLSYCLDSTVLVAPINQFLDVCTIPNESGINLTLDTINYCAIIEGQTVGQSTSCLVLCNEFGICDTTLLHINVHLAPTTTTIAKTLIIGESLDICPETEELTGLVTGIDNFCENNSVETIIFTINNVDLCFKIAGQNLGKDSICAVICDKNLICDTTYYIISVVSSTPSLTATLDLDTTSINSPVIIDILGNDSIPDGVITNMDIIIPNGASINGTASINLDGSLTYEPNQDFCGDSDELQYRICNETGCDTTTVEVYVDCTMLPTTTMKFFSGFSPNGDGQNDFFTVEGISEYPNNELSVFNRWGTEVFKMNGYKNAWDGTWNEKRLPDGTYFYVLQDGEGKQYKGFVQISR